MKSPLGLTREERKTRLFLINVLGHLRKLNSSLSEKEHMQEIETAFYDLKYMVHKDFTKHEQMRAAVRLCAYTVYFVTEKVLNDNEDSDKPD